MQQLIETCGSAINQNANMMLAFKVYKNTHN